MKDIDFDELDRAVSSVLGQDKPVQAETTAEKVVVSSAPKKTEDDQPTEPEPAISANAITINPRPKTNSPRPSGPSLATSRRGKFMDVMHQSVQSQAQSQKPPVEPAPKRGMVTLEPSKELQEASEESKPEVPEDTAKVEKAAEPVVTASAVEQAAEPTATLDESNALIGAEPAPAAADLLETIESKDDEKLNEKDEKDENEPTKSSSSKLDDDLADMSIEDVPATNSSLSSSVPQDSPFLADTKVEKRPLGGSSETNESEDELASYGLDTKEKNDVQSAPVVPVPRELEDDIVKVEAAQNEQDQAVTSSPFATNVATSAEASDDGRVDGHPLFDTSTYHEPIAAVHHDGMPGWAKWLIGLLLCLALGAGVGYFLFTAGL